MFRRESVTYVVFDESRVIDLPEPAERDGFMALSVHLLPDAAVLRIVPSQGRHVALSRDAAGWRLQASGTAPLPRPIVPAVSRSQIRFDAPFGGHALTIADPDNGAALLIGTLRRPGWGVDTERRSADFVVVPTVQGVVVEALSDRALLRADAQGFVLRATGAGLSVNVPVR
jgi:hypothetical protein